MVNSKSFTVLCLGYRLRDVDLHLWYLEHFKIQGAKEIVLPYFTCEGKMWNAASYNRSQLMSNFIIMIITAWLNITYG